MTTGRRVLAALAGTALAVTAITVTGPQAHAADTVVPLGLIGVNQLAVDDAHQEVFLVDGQDVVEVRGFDGTLKGNVTGQTGARSVAVAPGGGAVYVALQGAGAVTRIDPVTLTETARYPVAGVRAVAFSGSRLFVSFLTGFAGSGQVAELDLAANPPAPLAAFGSGWYSAPLLTGDPTGGHLVAVQDGLSPGTVTSYDLSQSPPTAVSIASVPAPGSNCRDAAVEPSGGDVVVACGAPYVHNAYRTSDLGLSFSYPTTNYPDAAAATTSGVALGVDGALSADIFMMSRHATTPSRTIEVDPTGSSTWTLAPRGLAFSGDGTRLFAVSTQIGGGARFHVFADPFTPPPPPPTAPALTLAAPATAPRAVPLSVTGTLTGTPALPAGTPLTVSRTDMTGTHALPGVTTDVAGVFTVADTPPVGGTNTYTVSFAGDAGHLAATASAVVTVSRATPVLTITTDKTLYGYNGLATVTAHLGPTFSGRAVQVWYLPANAAARTLIASGTVNAAGNLVVSHLVVRKTTFSVTFAGDERYAPRTAAVTIAVSAKLDERLSGYYATSGSYALYRTTVNPVMAVRVSPSKVGCVGFRAERYSAGAWRLWATTTSCGVVLNGSIGAASLTGSHPRGYNFRMRVFYSGDLVTAPTTGIWKYFKFP